MARTKTYRSKLYTKYSTRIPKGDEFITVEFNNGFRIGGTFNGGVFSTSDESIQEAIEATEKFKKGDIYCTFDSNDTLNKTAVAEIEKEVILIPEPTIPILPIEAVKPEIPTTEPIIPIVPTPEYPKVPIVPQVPTAKIIESVKTRQEARMYFRDAGEKGMTPTLSNEVISKLALKYNVTFPNLK